MYNVLKMSKKWWNNVKKCIYRNRNAFAIQPHILSILLITSTVDTHGRQISYTKACPDQSPRGVWSGRTMSVPQNGTFWQMKSLMWIYVLVFRIIVFHFQINSYSPSSVGHLIKDITVHLCTRHLIHVSGAEYHKATYLVSLLCVSCPSATEFIEMLFLLFAQSIWNSPRSFQRFRRTLRRNFK